MLTFKALLDKLDAAKAFPSDLDTAGRKEMVNEVGQRILESGKFIGTQDTIDIAVDNTGVFSLPRQFSTVLGYKADGSVYPMASKWWAYAPGATDQLQKYARNMQPLGTGFATFVDPTAAVTLSFTSSQSDSGTIHVDGLDEDGNEVFSSDGTRGIDITITSGSSSPTVQTFTKITALVLPVTAGVITLTGVYTDATTVTLGHYEPGETNPNYTRYLIPFAQQKADDETVSVTALCQRQFVPLVSDYDIVYPSHVPAFKEGCFAINYSNQGENERYATHMNEAIRLLNNQLRLSRPSSERGAARVYTVGNPIGAGIRSTY